MYKNTGLAFLLSAYSAVTPPTDMKQFSRAARCKRVRRRGGCGCERASDKDTRSVFQLERQLPDSGCLCCHGRKSPSCGTEKTLRLFLQPLALGANEGLELIEQHRVGMTHRLHESR